MNNMDLQLQQLRNNPQQFVQQAGWNIPAEIMGEPPKEMLALYNYLHKQHMNEAMKIRVMQGMYKEA